MSKDEKSKSEYLLGKYHLCTKHIGRGGHWRVH